MKWYNIETPRGWDVYESMLYSSMCVRQIWLPTLRSQINQRVFYKTLRVPIDPKIKHFNCDLKRALTQGEFDQFIEQVCKLAPEHADAIRALPPGSLVGHLMLTRIGPSCPDIEIADGSYSVREVLKVKLQGVAGIEFFPAYLAHIVPLRWELGQPAPEEFKCGEEAEDYILEGRHSPKVAAQMGKFYEVVLPPNQVWHEIGRGAISSNLTRVAFEGGLPGKGMPNTRDGLVEIAVEDFGRNPWFRVLAAEEDTYGAYDFICEDVVAILAEHAKWTLNFREIQIW